MNIVQRLSLDFFIQGENRQKTSLSEKTDIRGCELSLNWLWLEEHQVFGHYLPSAGHYCCQLCFHLHAPFKRSSQKILPHFLSEKIKFWDTTGRFSNSSFNVQASACGKWALSVQKCKLLFLKPSVLTGKLFKGF